MSRQKKPTKTKKAKPSHDWCEEGDLLSGHGTLLLVCMEWQFVAAEKWSPVFGRGMPSAERPHVTFALVHHRVAVRIRTDISFFLFSCLSRSAFASRRSSCWLSPSSLPRAGSMRLAPPGLGCVAASRRHQGGTSLAHPRPKAVAAICVFSVTLSRAVGEFPAPPSSTSRSVRFCFEVTSTCGCSCLTSERGKLGGSAALANPQNEHEYNLSARGRSNCGNPGQLASASRHREAWTRGFLGHRLSLHLLCSGGGAQAFSSG